MDAYPHPVRKRATISIGATDAPHWIREGLPGSTLGTVPSDGPASLSKVCPVRVGSLQTHANKGRKEERKHDRERDGATPERDRREETEGIKQLDGHDGGKQSPTPTPFGTCSIGSSACRAPRPSPRRRWWISMTCDMPVGH